MDKTISHYEILEEVGRGGMGVVYKARDKGLDRLVALKLLPSSFSATAGEKERFYREGRAASALSHPNITTVYEIGEHEGQLFLAMEFVEGETLKMLVSRGEPLAPPQVLDIALQAADGLSSAHEKGIIHRDIKSDNIMLTPRGRVKIMDFGLARLKGATQLTQAGSTMGTAAYMSPEQAQGGEVDQRTDIFSFGVVLYELLAGRLPFRGDHEAALLYAVVNEEPPPLARYNEKMSPELERIVRKALAKDRSERYQHMDDLLADLTHERKRQEHERLLHASVVTPPLAPRPMERKAVPYWRRAPARYLLVGVLIVVAVLAFIIFNPFNFQISTEKGKAATEDNSLAVLYFMNIPDPEDKDHTGDMLTDLLSTALSQSRDLQVVSRERLYAIQKDLGIAENKAIPPSMATRVAERAGVQMILLGSVLEREPTLTVTARLVNVKTGAIIASQRLAGYDPRQIFALVDTLAQIVHADVAPKAAAASEHEQRGIQEVTTKSPEAYRAYVTGVSLTRRFFVSEARAALNQAIVLDSAFAMAYFRLADRGLSDNETRRPLLQKAWDLRDHVSEKERMLIEAEYLVTVEGRYKEAAGVLEEFLRKYPRETEIYNELEVAYGMGGEFARALDAARRAVRADSLDAESWGAWGYLLAADNRREEALHAVDREIALAPAEPNPYDSKGEIYFMLGEQDSALVWYHKALAFRGDFITVEKIGYNALLRQNYKEAAEDFRRMRESGDRQIRALSDYDSTLILLHQGRLHAVRARLETGLPELERSDLEGQFSESLRLLGLVTHALEDNTASLAAAQRRAAYLARHPADRILGRDLVAVAFQWQGNSDAASKLLEEISRSVSEGSSLEKIRYHYASALVAAVRKKYGEALEQIRSGFANSFPNHAPTLLEGLALLKTGQLDLASSVFERTTWWSPISWPPVNQLWLADGGFWPFVAVVARYYLGVVREQQGRREDAAHEYRKFLDLWKNADFPSPEVKDARARLAHLENVSAR